MEIIHVVNALPRHVQTALTQRLSVMPAVVVTGARQTGKSTLIAVIQKARSQVSRGDVGKTFFSDT